MKQTFLLLISRQSSQYDLKLQLDKNINIFFIVNLNFIMKCYWIFYMRSIFCIACPDAPFTKLSIAENIINLSFNCLINRYFAIICIQNISRT